MIGGKGRRWEEKRRRSPLVARKKKKNDCSTKVLGHERRMEFFPSPFIFPSVHQPPPPPRCPLGRIFWKVLIYISAASNMVLFVGRGVVGGVRIRSALGSRCSL